MTIPMVVRQTARGLTEERLSEISKTGIEWASWGMVFQVQVWDHWSIRVATMVLAATVVLIYGMRAMTTEWFVRVVGMVGRV